MVIVVHMRVFSVVLTRLTTLRIYKLVVDDTMDGEDNLEETLEKPLFSQENVPEGSII